MKCKVYFNSSYFLISDSKSTIFSETLYACENKSDVQKILHEAQALPHFEIMLFNANFDDIFSWFAAEFTYIPAAGGAVQNQYGEFLFIYRNAYLDLPKGKFEIGETPEQAALREVCEETGLQTLSIEKFLCSTWHTYPYKGGFALKQTYWFAMNAPKEQPLTPQIEEGISETLWLAAPEISAKTSAMYASVKDVWERIIRNE